MKTLLIDNYDSYTYNLFQLIARINGEEPFVIRNDSMTWEQLKQYQFDNIIISPGPGNPSVPADFGVCQQAIREAEVPILGVCLGHQGIGHVFGARVLHAPEVMHGRLSEVYHDESPMFSSVPQGFHVVRYHSLMIEDPLPEDLVKTAWTQDGIIMGVRHKHRPIWGVQYHPESICTEYGDQLIENFKHFTENYLKNSKIDHKNKTFLSTIAHLHCVPKGSPEKQPLSAGSLPEYEVAVKKLNRYIDPDKVFVRLFSKEAYSFWLDSNTADTSMSRFSFMGSNMGDYSQIITYRADTGVVQINHKDRAKEVRQESIYDYLDRLLVQIRCETELPFDFNCGLVGYLGYEMKAESMGDLAHISPLPDSSFILADRIVAFDHLEKQVYLMGLAPKDKIGNVKSWISHTENELSDIQEVPPVSTHHWDGSKLRFKLNQSYEQYLDAIQRIKKLLRDGETYEINLTNEISVDIELESLDLYRTLRVINPAPYSAYLKFDDCQILCSSPERFIRVDRSKKVEAKPIKGTIRRGQTPDDDTMLREKLRNSEKDHSENLMIVDLLRNDLGLVCEVGSVHVPKLMDVESFQTVHQLVSTVSGQLREDVTTVTCMKAAFPGGSMTGAPKIRSMQIIDQIEERPRGIYSGCIGYLAANGSADMNIVIRTIVNHQGRLTIGVGGAIVISSDPDSEYDEILLKASALIRSIVTLVCGQYDESFFEIIGDRVPNLQPIG